MTKRLASSKAGWSLVSKQSCHRGGSLATSNAAVTGGSVMHTTHPRDCLIRNTHDPSPCLTAVAAASNFLRCAVKWVADQSVRNEGTDIVRLAVFLASRYAMARYTCSMSRQTWCMGRMLVFVFSSVSNM